MRAPLLFLPAIIALAATLISCGDAEEVAPTATVPGALTATSQQSASPAPASATSTPAPAPTGWKEYTDPALGFSFRHSAALAISEEPYELPEKVGVPAAQGRLIWFRNADGVPAIVLAIAPNPGDLTIEQWVNTYTGWSGDKRQELVVGGERAVMDPKDQVNNPVAQVYFRHGSFFFTLQVNTKGIPESGQPAALTDADFRAIVEGFAFAQ